ncbi:ABC transporter ATP-binding protein [Xylanimonas protaetiae]|uniref:Fatty acid ABC transporter ATP-binding/permease protein n=2 Tax=Xylanimonas protaetiae TaxID=2509457 RepID=A0A4P6F8G2_9MICO|nr:ABC transporter ATP-binding protein [Xylanimonas protaetiae]QAY71835.1 ABC transporter ATP-binding protein [Xylanimonas protaetiae]
MSEEEKHEIAMGEAARLASDSWDGVMPGKASDFKGSFFRMIGLLAPYKVALIIVTLMGAASVVLSVWAPRVLGRATDVLFTGVMQRALPVPPGTPQDQVVQGLRDAGQGTVADMVAGMEHFVAGAGIDFDRLRDLMIGVLAIYVGAAILGWAQGFITNILMVKAMWRLREDVEAKINRLPLSYFDKVQRGELISRVTNDIDNITQTMQQSLSGAITAVLTLVGVLVMMFNLSWQLALITLATLPLMAVVFGVIGPKSQKAFSLQWRKVGRLNARVEESFSGHALVKTFGRRQDFQARFAAENQELYEQSFRAQFLANVMWPAMSFIGNVTYVAVAVVGGLFVAGGTMTLGAVQAFIQYSQMFSQPLQQLGGMVAVVQSGTASAERVFQLLDVDEQEPDAADAPAPVEGDGVIEFEHVRFSYSPDKPLIEDLSFTVRPGQTVAIVGHTGAGKTTLVNLLMRFYDPQGGRILVDGQDIADLTRHDARARTGMVLQDTWLFAGTIRENIRYGRQDATDEEVLEAARATYVDRFVHSLPHGYDTELEEDAANLSAGERQLVTIARAFVSRPSILILDEATSSVDTRTEKLLQHAMASLRSGRTSFVIAHRLSTIRDADLILVMEHGAIVEQGNHEELLAAGGAYAELYQSQFTGAFDEEPEVEQASV